METALIIAIVAGAVSLMCAFITWYQAERIKKLEVKTQAEIEKLKLEKEKIFYALEMSAKHSEDKEKHLSKIWSSLQDIKEDVNFVLSYDFRDMSGVSAETFERINLKGKILISLYSEQGLDLPIGIRHAVHDTKKFISVIHNLTLEFKQKLKVRSSKKGDSLSAELLGRIENIKETFTRFRDLINFAQMAIANEREVLREKKFNQYLEMMSPQESKNLEKRK